MSWEFEERSTRPGGTGWVPVLVVSLVLVVALVLGLKALLFGHRGPRRVEVAAGAPVAPPARPRSAPAAEPASAPVARAPARMVVPPALTALSGVRLDPARPRSLALIGVLVAGAPGLSAARLADYFAIALRSYYETGRAPAVSIDPTPEQIRQGMDMTGDQNVRYEGGCAGTALGLMSFAADRRMKCLAFGRDNLTQADVAAAVPGYENTLDMKLREKSAEQTDVRHRLWIEPEVAEPRLSRDGRTVGLDVKMHVAVKRQAVQGAKLVDVDVAPDPVTGAFARHFTDHYAQFEALDPTYAEVHAAAQMSVLARLVWERAANSDPADDLAVDAAWWRQSFAVQPVWTPATTPIGRASKAKTETSKETTARGYRILTRTSKAMAVGGVAYEPRKYSVGRLDELPRAPAGSRSVESVIGEGAPAGARAPVESRPPGVLHCAPDRGGGKVTVEAEGGRRAITLGANVWDTPVQPGGAEARQLFQRLQPAFVEASGPGEARELIVCSPERPATVANFLGQVNGDVAFAGREKPMATEHYQKLEALVGKPRRICVVIETKSLSQEQLGRLCSYELRTCNFLLEQWLGSAAHVPEDADTVVIVGEHGTMADGQLSPLATDIKAAGQSGRLAGKTVVCLNCGSPKFEAFVNSLFDDPKLAPTCVYGFLGEVDVATVPGLLEALSGAMDAEREARPDALVDRALERLATEGPTPQIRQGAETMKRLKYKQLSERIVPEGEVGPREALG